MSAGGSPHDTACTLRSTRGPRAVPPVDLRRMLACWVVATATTLLSACATAPAGDAAAPSAPPAAPTVPTAPAPIVAVPSAPAVATPPQAASAPRHAALDPLRPLEWIDPDDAAGRTDLWARVRQGFALPTLDNDLVRKWEQWYAARPDYVQRMTGRGARYLFHIVDEVNRRGLPTELALLPFVESAYNPQAMSTAKASGMWQFVPSTGRDFSLKQNVFRDDRRDVLASTRAALDYLQSLHDTFGDWQLALAAYNWGQGNVQKALTRQRRLAGQDGADATGSYAGLRMPDETRNYLPKLQAVKNIIDRPQDFGLALPELQNHPYFLSVPIERDIDVDLAARLAGLPLDEFRQLNPQMNHPVILAAGTPQVLLPYDSAGTFLQALARRAGPLASWTAWVAPRTLKTSEAARLVGMDEPRLREVNRIPRGMRVKAGSTLLVPRNGARAQDVSEQVADNAVLALAPDLPPLRRISFRAGRKGDSVAAVARRYRVAAVRVAEWNRTTADARFKPGASIVVLVARSAAAPRAAAKPVRLATRAAASPVRRSARPGPAARLRLAQN